MIKCPHCTKTFPLKGIHTHIARIHGSSEIQAKYSNGYNGKYNDADHKKKLRNILLKRYNIFDQIRNCLFCNIQFTVLSSSSQKFCSGSCSAKHHNKKRWAHLPPKLPIKPRKIYKTEDRKCIVCGTNFQTKEYNSKTTCSTECRRKHPNCGGKRNSKRFPYKGVILDSTYELELAKSLDYNIIEWIRPKYLLYNMNGKQKRYHPDFYLPKYNVYLDPKNDYLIKIDQKKIQLVEEQHRVVIVVLNSEQLQWRNSIIQINEKLRGAGEDRTPGPLLAKQPLSR